MAQKRKLFNLVSGVAASTKVGHFIGARSAHAARRAGHAAALLSIILGAIVMIILLLTKDVSSLINSVPPIRPVDLSSRMLLLPEIWISVQCQQGSC